MRKYIICKVLISIIGGSFHGGVKEKPASLALDGLFFSVVFGLRLARHRSVRIYAGIRTSVCICLYLKDCLWQLKPALCLLSVTFRRVREEKGHPHRGLAKGQTEKARLPPECRELAAPGLGIISAGHCWLSTTRAVLTAF